MTHIYKDDTFEQSECRKSFVIMNPKSRQKAATPVETDFFKLLNNRNFEIDCRNNIDNCILEPLYDDFGQISYIKKFTAIFNDDSFRHFFHRIM